MNTSTVTEKGQTTIPGFIRKYMGLHPGSKIAYVTLPDGSVLLKALADNIRSLKGMLSAGKKATLSEMAAAIGRRRKARFAK